LLVGVSVLDDLPAIGLLTLASLLGAGVTAPANGTAPDWIGVGITLLVIALAAASFPISRWWHSCHGSWRPGPLGVLLLLTGCSWLGELSGLTSLLGALWGGVLLQRLAPMQEETVQADDLRRQLALLSDVFLPLFFLSVGMRIEAATLLEPSSWGMAGLLFLLALLCKAICAIGVTRRDQAAGVDRWLVVFGLLPRGLPGLVFASTALAAGLISPAQFSALVLMVSGTTVVGLLLLGRRLAGSSPTFRGSSQVDQPR
jgi:Kef-type K+ transport system membrane component KefB